MNRTVCKAMWCGIVLLTAVLLGSGSMIMTANANQLQEAGAGDETEAGTEDETEKKTEKTTERETENDLTDPLEFLDVAETLDLEAIEKKLLQMDTSREFSFTDTVRKLLKGDMPFHLAELPELLGELFLREIRQQKRLALQILVVVLASAVFANFVHVFDSSQIADISFYMMYLLISVLLMQAFMEMHQIILRTCSSIYSFMKVLLPSYMVTIVFCSGSASALGFYEISVLGMNLLQILILKGILPAVRFYLTVLLLNQMSREDYFSRIAELIRTVIEWLLKTVVGVVVGLQTVQCLIAPAVDQLKNSAAHRIVKAIPGVGTALDAAAETVAGSAIVLKNAVGVAGILALIALCITPLVKLVSCILIFRFLCALIQPVSDRRMVDGIESISGAALLLLRILVSSLAVFVISLAMITASIRGV